MSLAQVLNLFHTPRTRFTAICFNFSFFSLTDYIIQAGGVKEIIVADAEIYPDQGEVTVETSAFMRKLENATIFSK